MNHKYDITKEELLEKSKTMTRREMAEFFGCSMWTIQENMRKYGIVGVNSKVVLITDEELNKVRAVAKDHTLNEIANLTSISKNRVINILIKGKMKWKKIDHSKIEVDIKKLKELIKTDKSIQDICNELNINEQIYYRALRENNIVRDEKLVKEIKLREQKNTNKERYGSDFYVHSEEFKKRIPEINEKAKQTNLGKYGEEWSANNKEIRQKREQTCLEKYGCKSPFGNKEVQKKKENTNLERYGYKTTSQNKEVRQKMIDTNRKKRGVDFPFQSKEVLEKAKDTCEEKYGTRDILSNKNVREKIYDTIQDKYGVKYACQLPQARSNYSNESKPNKEFAEKLDKIGVSYEREFAIKNRSYDFKIGKLLVEINPSAFHNSTIAVMEKGQLKDKYYHRDKTMLAEENGYRVIHIWDWDDIDKVIKVFIEKKQRIYARDCEIKEVENEEMNRFLNEYHLQGTTRYKKVAIGLYYKGELVELMTFGTPRYNKNCEYELLRLCSSKTVIGGAERLFKYFIKTYKVKSVVSYCDSSKFNGDVYKELGFAKYGKTAPSKHWYHLKKKVHITDNLLRQHGYDRLIGSKLGKVFGKGTDNNELMIKVGFVEVYDCGQETYIWNE